MQVLRRASWPVAVEPFTGLDGTGSWDPGAPSAPGFLYLAQACFLDGMCGRCRTKMSFDQRQRLSTKAAETSNAQPKLDIRPTSSQWVIRGAPAESELTRMRWGLVPFWHGGKALKDSKLTTFNAKSETVATAASFKGPYKIRRCLVLADGWWEWTASKGSKERWVFTPRDGERWLTAGAAGRAAPTRSTHARSMRPRSGRKADLAGVS